ncbi:MAG TPA: phosphate ABC transporter permease subunit PstC [Gemmatimonadaceae bacterium]|nr:phosphate ABC transporter permease subunit PstC [Gemmatimonadaceae bacterium]
MIPRGQPAPRAHSRGDTAFKWSLLLAACTVPALLIALVFELTHGAWPAIQRFGAGFIFSTAWDPVAGLYGAWPAIFGTLLTSFLALLFAVPLALGVAIYLSEFAPMRIRRPIATVIELLAAIPSVVYGLWGIFVMIPFLTRWVYPVLEASLGFLPFFKGPVYGPSILSAALSLTVMIIPFIMSVSREVLQAVPAGQREAALALGATRWEAVSTVIVPYAKSGIIGAVILGLGRALGETMAVTMLIGNRHEVAASLFAPGYSMAAVIANEFADAAGGPLHESALIYLALLLFGLTVLVNGVARVMIWRVARRGGAR